MAEYASTGIFGIAPLEMVGMLSYEALGLSAELAEAVEDWVARYEGWLNLHDPLKPAEVPDAEATEWLAEGKRLAERLQTELGDEYEVIYWHEGGRV
jgi:hypothetical protein